MKRSAWILSAAGLVVLVGGSVAFFGKSDGEVKWRMGKVDRGNITQRISATGSLNALVQVPVGTQVSGIVTALYADFNSLVKKGQVIARIDSTVWETQLRDAEATLQHAQASLVNAKAEYQRNKRLAEQNLISASDLDAKELTLRTAEASVASAKAAVARARINLGYCTITAPVDGVVVSRLVDEGQTVAASYSTPNLFTIAQDLSKLKVQASIDEADIGQVSVGQQAFFTVDSYPDRQFRGQVTEVQLSPTVNNNVVTYTVVMEVANEPKAVAASPSEGGRGMWRRGQEGGQGREGGKSSEARQGHEGGHGHGSGAQGVAGTFHRGNGGSDANGGMSGMHRRSEVAKAQPKITGQVATLESNTARYIPVGSTVYKGELALFPGMTANVTIVTNQRKDVMRVANAALRFNPNAFLKDDKKPSGQNGNGQRPSGSQGTGNKGGMMVKREDRIWILENGKPKALPVVAGITDGQFTEVSGEGLQEGLQILVGVEDAKKAATTATPMLGGPGGPPRR